MSMKPFGIGIHNHKYDDNVGTLWRSAFQLGASFVFTSGNRYKYQKSDTYKTWKQIPFLYFEDMLEIQGKDMEIVGVEICDDAIPLPDFKHPNICAYVLGNESYGLSEDTLSYCDHIITIPSVRTFSYNVSMAGTLVMYDRLMKQQEEK